MASQRKRRNRTAAARLRQKRRNDSERRYEASRAALPPATPWGRGGHETAQRQRLRKQRWRRGMQAAGWLVTAVVITIFGLKLAERWFSGPPL